MTAEDFARELLEARPDRFASLLADAPAPLAFAAASTARTVATLVRATRATYVLLVEGEPPPSDDGLDAAAAERLAAGLASYRTLHIAGAFGHTGQVEVVERGPKVADGIRQAAERYALAEHVRVHSGKPPTVVHALNGPYDLIVLGGRWREYERMEEDLTRLLRIGGSLTIINAAPLAASEGREAEALRSFLSFLAADERYLLSTGLDFAGVLAARIR
ncbi:MAG: hypothetical protein OXG61_03000 [Chloroflexi bacterium]|nr:hypothetical protein [Chloroflexota bacterium]